jgi:chorismate mutase
VPDAKRQFEELRQEIAKLDLQLVAALDKRARTARRLGELRKEHAPQLPVTDRASIESLVARSNGDMAPEALRDIFREIFGACLALELPVKVVYVGPEGGAGHAAAGGRFGHGSNLASAETTPAALEEVSRRRAEFAVVPFETSIEGLVHATIQALAASDLRAAEMLDASFDLSGGERIRYAVVGVRPSGRTGADITSLVFTVQEGPGTLLDVLKALAERGVDLRKIESHPARGEPWHYVFYAELAGHFTDRQLVTAFEEMKRLTRSFKVLGSYPAP